jgi:ankyrin repeat protein
MRTILIYFLLALTAIASPLYDAIDSNDSRLVTTLLQNGADPYERRNTKIEKGVIVDSAFCYAAEISDEKTINAFSSYIDNVNQPCLGNTPLIHAAAKGNIPAMRILLKNGADIDKAAMYSYHDTPLMAAANKNQIKAMAFLITHGANVNDVGSHDFSALTYTIGNSNPTTAQLLIDSGFRLESQAGFEAMKMAVLTLKYDMVKFLLDHKYNPNLKDQNENTVLHLIARGDIESNIRNLEAYKKRTDLPKALHDTDAIQKNIDTLKSRMHYYPTIIRELLLHGANRNTKNMKGKTPVDLAKENKIRTVLEVLQ